MPCEGLGEDNGRGEFGGGESPARVFDFSICTLLKRILAKDFQDLVEEHGRLKGRLFVGLLQGIEIALKAGKGGALDGCLRRTQEELFLLSSESGVIDENGEETKGLRFVRPHLMIDNLTERGLLMQRFLELGDGRIHMGVMLLVQRH